MKEEFIPLEKGVVRIYSCGPTIYDYAHIGNWRSFIFSDLLRRYLRFKGFNVIDVMNLTDVDDKTIRGSRESGIPLKEYTDRYAKAFFEDMRTLNIRKQKYMPRATDVIPDIVHLIKRIMEKGHAYESNGSIYFKISTFKDYGKLAHLDFNKLIENAQGRLKADNYDKENARDFALWKAWDEEDGDVFWETELGKGRPGWHIECSTMSMKYLGETLDIHTGGIDLIFPHHTNEIAQSESATGKRFVRYWMHNEFLLIDKEKMSKSLGNFFTLRDLLARGYKPVAIRYVLLATHYRQQLSFGDDAIKSAENSIARMNNFIREMQEISDEGKAKAEIKDTIEVARKKFEEAMDDDLNISEALSTVFGFIKNIYNFNSLNKGDASLILKFMEDVNTVLGVMNFEQDIPREILALKQERDEARKNKDWEKADRLREVIRSKGFEVFDDKEGSKVRKITS